MASAAATAAFDGDKKRVYIVPPDSFFTLDINGIRIYTPNNILTAPDILTIDVRRDIWSRGVDWWAASNDWVTFALISSGGNIRGIDEQGNNIFQSVDYTLDVANGWKLVLPNYTSETHFKGNLFSNETEGKLFDSSAITALGVTSRLDGAADLLTYVNNIGSGVTEQDKIDISNLTRDIILSTVAQIENSQDIKDHLPVSV